MPKKTRQAIGYVRPKKRPISQDQELSEEPTNTTELEGLPEEAVPVPPEADLSAMSITDGGSNDVPPQERQENQESKEKAEWKKALRKAAVARRRWCKTARTHFNDEDGGARWKTDSELKRVVDRLQKADDERAEAHRRYVDAHRQLMLSRSLKNLSRRAEQEQDVEKQNELLRLVVKTHARFARHNNAVLRHLLYVKGDLMAPKTPMPTGKQIELLCEHAGLAQAYEWVHMNELR